MPPKNARRTDSVTARFPFSVSRFPSLLSCSTRHSILVAREAGRIRQLERMQRLGERVTHPGLRLIDQDRANVDAPGSDHPAGGALELLRLFVGELPALERLPRLVRPQPLLLRPDPEEGQDLQPRPRQS